MGKSGKLFSLLMSIVLTLGLMPAPAFAESPLWAGEFAEPQEDAAESESLPLREAGDAAGSALSALGASVMGAVSALGGVQDDPVVLDSGTCGENLTWEYWDDARLVISGTGEMDDYTASTQPWSGYMTRIERVVLETGVSSIGDYAFSGAVLASAYELPGTLTHVGSYALSGNGQLQSVAIPDSVTELGNYVFYYDCKLQSCQLPARLDAIPDYAFAECSALLQLNIPTSVTSIGQMAFCRCRSMGEVVIPDGVTSVGMDAFLQCNSNSDVVIPGSLKKIGDNAFRASEFKKGIIVSEGVEVIGSKAFDSTDATWVKLPSTLLDIVSPDSLHGLNITKFEMADGGSPFFANDGVLFKRDASEVRLFKYPNTESAEYAVPEGTTSIVSHAFIKRCYEQMKMSPL